jgi:hypothetical protein
VFSYNTRCSVTIECACADVGLHTPYALPPYALTPYALPPYALTPYALPPYALTPYALPPTLHVTVERVLLL